MLRAITELPREVIDQARDEANEVLLAEKMFDAGVLVLAAISLVAGVVVLGFLIGHLDPFVARTVVAIGG